MADYNFATRWTKMKLNPNSGPVSHALTLSLKVLKQIICNSQISRTIKTDTQGCGVGLGDAKLSPFNDITLFDTETQKSKLST